MGSWSIEHVRLHGKFNLEQTRTQHVTLTLTAPTIRVQDGFGTGRQLKNNPTASTGLSPAPLLHTLTIHRRRADIFPSSAHSFGHVPSSLLSLTGLDTPQCER